LKTVGTQAPSNNQSLRGRKPVAIRIVHTSSLTLLLLFRRRELSAFLNLLVIGVRKISENEQKM